LVEDYFKNLLSENTQEEEYPPLIKKLSGVISENDLKKLSGEDDRVKYILRRNNVPLPISLAFPSTCRF
jgi:hypothetical protein